jgi:phosphatidylserine/phosphatidylglycerophosphate/cardiolipin synthase-like enzyme
MSLGILNNIKVNEDLRNKNNVIAFKASTSKTVDKKLPKVNVPTPKDQNPVKLPGVPLDQAKRFIEVANEMGVSIGDFFAANLKQFLKKVEGVPAEPSVTAAVGKTKVTSLIDAKQIFDKTVDYIKNAEKTIQIEMFEFQNLKIDADLWPSGGAETLPGWHKQQEILDLLIKKKKADPNMNIQVILDAHKWYQDGFGDYKRHYANMKMIKHLKENGIDVVPYPRSQQGGTVLQHVKFLAVDSKKVILGGMNWGNHSSANHDACIAIETDSKYKHSEVDNIIEKIFNQDWKFAWQRLANTKFVPGPTTPEEQKDYKGKAKEIKQEAVEYMKIVGNLFDNPENKQRYASGELNLPEVKPITNPKINVLMNNPREYSFIGAEGEESIGAFIKERLNTATSMRAELFVLSHKEIVNKIIERHKEAQSGGRPFDVQILISPGILDDFPYCRKAFQLLEDAGVPIRVYKVNKDLSQRLHTKWAVFDNSDLMIGSANWSAVGLENNITTGQRPDYPLTNNILDKRIAEYKPRIDVLEKELKLSSLYNEDETIDYPALKERRSTLKSDLSKIESNNLDNLSTIQVNKLDKYKKLLGYYNLIKIHEERKEKYKRGNHECAVVVPSPKIAQTFLNQFNKDWEFSTPSIPDGYGLDYTDEADIEENYADVAFTGKKMASFITAKEPRFNKLV